MADTIEVNSLSSPPKLLKRKRRQSRSLSESKEKRKFKAPVVPTGIPTHSTLPDSVQVGEDVAQPSTSTAPSKRSKSPLIKKKKIIRKRNAATVLKKKRIVLSE